MKLSASAGAITKKFIYYFYWRKLLIPLRLLCDESPSIFLLFDCVPPCLGRVSGWWVGADFNGLPINFFRIKFFFWPSHFDQLGLMLLLLSFHEFWSIFKDFASIFVLLPLLPPLDWTQSGLSLCCWETAVAYCSAQPGRRYSSWDQNQAEYSPSKLSVKVKISCSEVDLICEIVCM